MNPKADILFVSHGGGPLPLLGDPAHQDMVTCLHDIADHIPTPSAILVISAHWEARVPTITAGAQPALVYDYGGFPPASYHIQYPCPGAPALAQRIHHALERNGIAAQLDTRRGFDHGVFVPLKILFPQATIPVVQLSLNHNLNADTHLAMGNALQALSTHDHGKLLVLGSGFSFHNMRAFFSPHTPDNQSRNRAFERWLLDTCSNTRLTEAERQQRFSRWADAPHARFCHPREEHLLPLHVCYGMAGRACDQHWSTNVLGKQSGMFYWAGQG